ncbi:MAG: Cna B-type domain-containing protein, partial [Ruminococcus sp.]|nr:Cna B-type domain-containing protein [Ruminococcus sp.]
KTIILESSDVVGSDNWAIEVKDLPVYDSSGTVYNYWVKEDDAFDDEYNISYRYNGVIGNGINASNPGNGSIEVINNDKSTDSIYLPEAGGNGTRIYYIASGIILLLTTLGYIAYRSRKASLREE